MKATFVSGLARYPQLISAAAVAMLLPVSASAQDWYIHRTSEKMSVPPWHCYCYRMTQANVIPGVGCGALRSGRGARR
jgi:hypothetical protein